VLLSTPDGSRARTVGTLNSLYAATMMTSAATAGVAADIAGAIPVLVVAASLQVVAGPVFLLMTRERRNGPDDERPES
jgi:hypothetical protein